METNVVEEGKLIKQKELYHYGNITTRISLDVSPPESPSSSPDVDCGLCWMLLFSLCPVSALLSSLLSSFCVYSFCRTTAAAETQVPLNRTTTRGSERREKEEGDLCYASLDIRQGQRRPKKKKRVQNSDFSTYTAINTSRLHPCSFFSHRLNAKERNYDVGNRELLAVKMALEEWGHWLEGAEHPFIVWTDHKNLEYLHTAKRLNSRQARWALLFTRFNTWSQQLV
ncbi:uncharacterized protein LOC123484298 [Coregonus clupeaformis]|uniref:uncharacterized protein LOC123484298 n=1 Tax=Coregonus clupeaformis TaxID=59861 RepID=UPI001E1C6341|nr:uncharacterized protein LOC123484298 [Coregonus clupeaformis]